MSSCSTTNWRNGPSVWYDRCRFDEPIRNGPMAARTGSTIRRRRTEVPRTTDRSLRGRRSAPFGPGFRSRLYRSGSDGVSRLDVVSDRLLVVLVFGAPFVRACRPITFDAVMHVFPRFNGSECGLQGAFHSRVLFLFISRRRGRGRGRRVRSNHLPSRWVVMMPLPHEEVPSTNRYYAFDREA